MSKIRDVVEILLNLTLITCLAVVTSVFLMDRAYFADIVHSATALASHVAGTRVEVINVRKTLDEAMASPLFEPRPFDKKPARRDQAPSTPKGE